MWNPHNGKYGDDPHYMTAEEEQRQIEREMETNMSKHTPGPWDWFESTRGPYLATPDRGRLYVMGFARLGMQGATPRFSHWDGIEGGAERERMGGIMCDGVKLPSGDLHPDAKLIKAAPELLELLKELIDIEGPQPGHIEWANKVKAAIAKATT